MYASSVNGERTSKVAAAAGIFSALLALLTYIMTLGPQTAHDLRWFLSPVTPKTYSAHVIAQLALTGFLLLWTFFMTGIVIWDEPTQGNVFGTAVLGGGFIGAISTTWLVLSHTLGYWGFLWVPVYLIGIVWLFAELLCLASPNRS